MILHIFEMFRTLKIQNRLIGPVCIDRDFWGEGNLFLLFGQVRLTRSSFIDWFSSVLGVREGGVMSAYSRTVVVYASESWSLQADRGKFVACKRWCLCHIRRSFPIK